MASGYSAHRGRSRGRAVIALSVLVILEVRPRRDVDAVVFGRRERPPVGRMRVVGEPAPRSERRCDAGLGLIGRDADVDVGAAPTRLGRVEPLERDVWIPTVWIDHILVCPKAPVAEGGGPERTDITLGVLGHGDGDDLDLGGVGLQAQRAGLSRDPPSELDVTLAQRSVVSRGGSDGHPVRADIHVRDVADDVGDLGDRGDESGALRE
jgi:hypothetical protein